ncbi:hypothetical protein JCM3765_004805 [Sporobolomyces pararoseus]
MDSYDSFSSAPSFSSIGGNGIDSTAQFAPPSLPSEHSYDASQPAVQPPIPASAPVPFYSSAPSPRARTHSTASSISSFHSSYLDTSSPDNSACTSQPSYDLPPAAVKLSVDGNGQGFVVEDSNVGRVYIGWDQLVQFLVNPQIVGHLAGDHPIAQASSLLASLPAPTLYDSTSFEHQDDNLEPLSAGLRGFNLNSNSLGSEIYESPQTAHPFRSNFPTSTPPHLPAPTAVLPPLPSSQRSIDPRTTFSNPLRDPSLDYSYANDFPSLPIPPARLRRSDLDSISRREESRNASSPYARPPIYQQTHLSTSSLQDFAGPSLASSSASFRSLNDSTRPLGRAPTQKEVEKKLIRDQLPKNEKLEIYAWSFHKSQLLRIGADSDRSESSEDKEETVWDEDGEVRVSPLERLEFPPKSYYRCFEDNKEVLPCDSSNRGNSFLRAQHCVILCNFRFELKRPSVIRHHVLHCKTRTRDWVGPDPLKRLCELQLEAQQIISRHSRRQPGTKRKIWASSEANPFAQVEAENSDAGDDRSSLYSFDSVDSTGNLSARRGGRPLSFVGSTRSSPAPEIAPSLQIQEEEDLPQDQNWWSSRPSTSDDPVRANVDASSSFFPRDEFSTSGSQYDHYQSTSHPSWLMPYGLKTPTLRTALSAQQQQQQHMVVDSPPSRPVPTRLSSHSRSDSFLAMD